MKIIKFIVEQETLGVTYKAHQQSKIQIIVLRFLYKIV
jgi:hypothetical protein